MSKRKRKWLRVPLLQSSGCGFLLLVSLIASILFVVNSAIVRMLYTRIAESDPVVLGNERFSHGVQIAIPALMILLEYRIYDYLVDRSETLSAREMDARRQQPNDP